MSAHPAWLGTQQLRASEECGASTGRWLTPLRQPWPAAVSESLRHASAVVRVLIAAKRGSAPRDAGTSMLVMSNEFIGTIGGGHLEWQALQAARTLLDAGGCSVQLQRLILGPQLAQCCGGAVTLWLERFTRRDLPLLRQCTRAMARGESVLLHTRCSARRVQRDILGAGTPLPVFAQHLDTTPLQLCTDGDELQLLEQLTPSRGALWLYGAGHVGQALVRLLGELPVDITWIDTRAELLPGNLPVQVRTIASADPLPLIRQAPAHAHHRVLTQDHSLDYALCREILLRNQFASLGLIGSRSKAARFRAQLRRDAVPDERIERLICPIGTPLHAQPGSKEPAAIAISIAAHWLTLPAAAAAPNAAQAPAPAPAGEALETSGCGDQHCAQCLTQVNA